MKILIAEDEMDMQKIIALYLRNEGYEVKTVSNGRDAMEVLYCEYFDLVILDWMMPFMDGISVCNEMKRLNIESKIIILTAKSQNDDEIKGLSCGADDYIRKPFDPKILLLRVGRLLGKDMVLESLDIVLNQKTHIVMKGGMEVKLSKKEYDLLRYFLLNTNIVLTREQLLNHIWGVEYEGDERTLDTHVRRLRSKIGEHAIRTHVGIGYCMGAYNE